MNSKQPNVVRFVKKPTHKDDWWIVHAPLVMFKLKHGINKKGS